MSRHIRRFLLALVVCALVAPTTGVASSQPAPRAQPAELGDHNGAPPDFVCEDRLAKIILPNGRTLCTHGPDPDEAFASESVDLAARAEAPWPCYTTGPAYHSLYLRTATQASRLPSLRTFFESSMRHVQGEFELSATDNGGPGKRLRVLTDAGCNLVIDEVVVTGSAMSDFSTMISELQNKGYNKADRKYLIWADASTYCGIGTFMSDDRKVSYNRNNSSISYARVDTRCWDSAEAHEIAHNLGAVQNSAPRSSGAGHCYDEYDHLCYWDGGSYFANGGSLVVNCPETHRNLMLDCRHDDYYDATGRSPYLSTHWNVATDSRYLVNATDTTPPPPNTTSTTSTSATSTSTTVPPTTAADNHLDADSATLEGSTGKWVGWYSATATRSAEQARSGVASLKVAPTGAMWGVTVDNWPGFPATAGNKTIAFSAQSSYAFTASLLVRWKNSSGTDITTDRLSPELNSTWQTTTATATAPSGTVSVHVELTGDKAPAEASVYFDDFYVGDSATATTTTTSTTTTTPPSTSTSSTSTSSTSTSTSTTTPPPTTTTTTTTTTPPPTTTTSSTTSTSTSTTSPSTTSTTSATGANPQAIVYSTSPNRALPAPLSDATVRSSIYAFVTNSGDISKVEFWLDNPDMTGSPRNSETLAPYDFAGGLISYAYAWNTTGVPDGLHTITARVTFKDATTKTTAATFTVDN